MKRTLNIGPFGVYLWGGILFASTAVFGAGSLLYSNQNTGTIYAQQLANGTPGAGKYPRGGACPTGTSIDTSTGTTDRQCWTKIQAADVEGLPSITGTVDYLPVRTTTGWGDSPFKKDGLTLSLGSAFGIPKLHVYDDGTFAAGLGAAAGDTIQVFGDSYNKRVSFGFKDRFGTFYLGAALFDGTFSIENGLTVKGLPGKAVNSVVYVTSTSGDLAAGPVTSLGAEPTLPACAPGQGIVYTGTGTGTSTAKGCGTTATSVNGFDPLGTYFLHNSEGPCFEKWNTFYPSTAVTSSATCSAGSDALLAEFYQCSSQDYENRLYWPGGEWLAKLNAKVNANGAAVRVEVWDSAAGTGGSDAQWFNWTTNVFTNTSFTAIQKQATGTERTVANRSHHVFFRLYATCSTSTQVTIQFADGSSRIESPIAKDSIAAADVSGLSDSISGLEAEIATKEPSLPAGRPGQGVGYLGTGTATGTTKGPIDLEAITTGIPGQFVKFLGTGTSPTTSKGGVDVTIPTPVTTRSFTVAASALNLGSGAVAGNLSSNLAIWTLRNAQSDYAYGAVITVPNDYVSGLSVAPMWYPIGADSNQAHTVKWAIGHMSMADAASYTLTYTSWTGKACGVACPATYALVNETAFGFGSYAAGNVVAIGIKRLGSDAADTYTGDLALAGLKFSYTSSL